MQKNLKNFAFRYLHLKILMLYSRRKNAKGGRDVKVIAFLLGCALLLITFFWPFWVYPFGSYTGSVSNTDVSINFHFDGTFETNLNEIAGTQVSGLSAQGYYTIKDSKIYISTQKDFEIENALQIGEVENFFTIKINLLVTEITMRSNVGIILTVVYGLLALGGFIALVVSGTKKNPAKS